MVLFLEVASVSVSRWAYVMTPSSFPPRKLIWWQVIKLMPVTAVLMCLDSRLEDINQVP